MNSSSSCAEGQQAGPQAADRAPPCGSCFPVHVRLDLFLVLRPRGSACPSQNPWFHGVGGGGRDVGGDSTPTYLTYAEWR